MEDNAKLRRHRAEKLTSEGEEKRKVKEYDGALASYASAPKCDNAYAWGHFTAAQLRVSAFAGLK